MSVCSVDGCDRTDKIRGWCRAHYQRWLNHGDTQPDKPLRDNGLGDPDKVCSVSGCERPHKARGWCGVHYERWRVNGDVQADKPIQEAVNHKYPTRVDGKLLPRYLAWSNLIQRCTNPSCPVYKHYGGRGIGVCERWIDGTGSKTNYECFWEDMGPRPEGYTLDRIDPEADYGPDNCQWAPDCVQAINQRSALKALAKARECGLTIADILEGGGLRTSQIQM